MTLRLVCNCGKAQEWEGETFAEISTAVEEAGWDIKVPTCPEHTEAKS